MDINTWLGGLLGSAGASGVSEVVNGIGDAALKVRSAITGNLTPDKAAEVEVHLADLEAQISASKDKLNAVDAASNSFFVAGWRPALGWVCSVSVGLYYIPRFLLGMYFWSSQVSKTGSLVQLPEMGIQDVLGLVAALLGMASLRTYEKVKNVHNEH